jgi:gentisate 1,2-dioxygenase
MAETHTIDPFHTAMESASVAALWEELDTNNGPPEPPHIWPWATMEPLIDAAIDAVSMDDAERRVLLLNSPSRLAEGRGNGTSVTLSAALQVLLPGERARPHRHTMNALRFVIDGAGADTVVDGKSCPMQRGDMILTPGWTWHEHAHDADGRIVWLDVLDVPLNRFLDNGVFEPGPARDLPAMPADDAFGSPGLVPVDATGALPYSPLFRYSWDSAGAALAALPAAADGTRRLRYTNPATGGPALATIDCHLVSLETGRTTTAYRTNSSAGCLVLEGAGRSQIGEDSVEWTRNDIFTLPAGHRITHEASAEGTTLFMFSDREILDRLGLLREQIGDPA